MTNSIQMYSNDNHTAAVRNIERLLAFRDYCEQTTGYGCVIAGGAVRDAIANREFRDIDIYVDERWFDVYKMFLYEGPFYLNDDYPDEDSVEYKHQSIVVQVEADSAGAHRFKFPWLEGHPINLIGINTDFWYSDGSVIAQNFNLSMSQTWLTKDSASYTDEFMKSFRSKTCSVLRETWGHEATINGVDKFKRKYPDFSVIFKDGSPYSEEELEKRGADFDNGFDI